MKELKERIRKEGKVLPGNIIKIDGFLNHRVDPKLMRSIAKEFVRDNIDVDILEDLLSLGGLGIQYCIKSEAAYANLKEITDELLAVDYTEFNDRYNQRDITARKRMRELVDSDANTVTKVFSTLFER